ncbi:MAG: crossover junction endodeoxyribonuclease RuvC [Bacteroidetes bacterium]|nr:crossover junction endodeoxyribonuclease RuvC [Bacteroidota bacterium]
MIILGIDPGSLVTGYGVISNQNRIYKMLDVGVIKNNPASNMSERLNLIYTDLKKIIKKFNPTEIAIETAFYGKNVQSALRIGEVRGVLLLIAAQSNLPIFEYSPRSIKKAVTGNGNATKHQIQFIMSKTFGMKTLPKYFDSTDALAIALCHSHRTSNTKKVFKDWKSYIQEHPEKILKRN